MKPCRLRIGLLIAIVLPLLTGRVDACSCINQTPCTAYTDASAVFIGRMLGGTERVDYRDTDANTVHLEAGAVRFIVEQRFKGDLGAEVVVHVASHVNTSCGPYGLMKGERYLVYAYSNDARGDRLSTGVCSRTKQVEGAGEDLDFLRNLPADGAGGRLYGSISVLQSTYQTHPLAATTVIITHERGQSIKVLTDGNGYFELNGLKAGKYLVEPVWPPNYLGADKSRSEVIVLDGGCKGVGFTAVADTRIKGRIVDAAGRPATPLFLTLKAVNAQSDSSPSYGHTNKEGIFEINGVPPGEYRLSFNLKIDWQTSRTYFYPGVWEQAEARIIRIELGQNLDGYDFTIPPEYSVRTVEGQVVWPTGTPAAGVSVMLLCPRSTKPNGYTISPWPPEVKTDPQGRFRLQGYSNEIYCLEARAAAITTRLRIPVQMHSLPLTLELPTDPSDIKLTLSAPGLSGDCCRTPEKQ